MAIEVIGICLSLAVVCLSLFMFALRLFLVFVFILPRLVCYLFMFGEEFFINIWLSFVFVLFIFGLRLSLVFIYFWS